MMTTPTIGPIKSLLSMSAAITLSAAIVSIPSAAVAQDKVRTYTVESGDTCTSIARDFYGDAQAYYHIHQNNDLSAQDYACREGTTLKLPVLPDRPEARLLARAGDVRAKPPKSAWDPIDVGGELFEAWRVNTLERSRAELGFQDSSELQMTENTLVVIYGPSKQSSRRTVARRARVDKGRLKTRLAGLSGKSVQIDTPTATANFDSGKAQVTVDDSESRVANHSGKPVTVASPNGSNAVAVKSGHGTRIKKGKPPEKPRPLPPTPAWSTGFVPQGLSLANAGGVVRASWNKVAQADAYYVEVSRDRRQIDVIFSEKTPATITNLEMRQLPPGDYYVSIVSIDTDKFESVPTKLRPLQVFELKVAGSQVVDRAEASVVLGATLDAPRGMECAVGDGAKSAQLTLRQPGTHQVNCTNDQGATSVTVDVVRPELTLTDPSARPAILQKGATGAIGVRFAPAVPDGVVARTSDGLAAKPLQVAPDELRINLTAAADAPTTTSSVELYFDDIQLGSFEVDVRSASTARTYAPSGGDDSEFFASALLGYDAAGLSPYWSPALSQVGGSVELGVGAIPSAYFAGEVRLGGALHAGTLGESSQVDTLLSLRAQAMGGAFESFAAPYAGLGVGWQLAAGYDGRASMRAAVGVMPSMSVGLRLRGEIAVDATPVDGTLRYLPQARLGVAYRF
jgi:hypothetical protein